MFARAIAWLRRSPRHESRPERRRRARSERKATKRRQRAITAGVASAQGNWDMDAGSPLPADGGFDGGGGGGGDGGGGGGGDGA